MPAGDNILDFTTRGTLPNNGDMPGNSLPMNDGDWHLVTMTVDWDGSNAFDKRIYIDGVLDAQRALIQARGQSMESLASYQKAVTELEGLIAQSIRDVDPAAPTHKEP